MTHEEFLFEYSNLTISQKRILQLIALDGVIDVTYDYYFYPQLFTNNSSLNQALLEQLAIESKQKKFDFNHFVAELNSLKHTPFLSDRGRLYLHYWYYLSLIAMNDENREININILQEGERLDIIPHRFAYDKFDSQDFRINDARLARNLSLAIHLNDTQLFQVHWDNNQAAYLIHYYRILFHNFDINHEWFNSRDPLFKAILCIANLSFKLGYNVADLDEQQQRYWHEQLQYIDVSNESHRLSLLNVMLAQLNFLRLDIDKIALDGIRNSWISKFLDGIQLFYNNDSKNALKNIELSIREFDRITPRDFWFYVPEFSVLYAICLLKEKKPEKIVSAIVKRLDKQPQLHLLSILLAAITEFASGSRENALELYESASKFINSAESNTRSCLCFALYTWLETLLNEKPVQWENVYSYLNESVRCQSYLAEALLTELLTSNHKLPATHKATEKSAYYRAFNLSSLIIFRAPWESSIDKLDAILYDVKTVTTDDQNKVSRLVWYLDPLNQEVEVKEQSRLKNGNWSLSKDISLIRLFNQTNLENIMTDKDKVALSALYLNTLFGNRYDWDYDKLLLNLVDHPVVFDLNASNVKLELVRSYPSLDVRSHKDGYGIILSHTADLPHVQVKKIASNKYEVIEMTQQVVNLSSLLGENGVVFPFDAKERVLNIVSRDIGDIKVNADIFDEDIPQVIANSECIVQLIPHSPGLIMSIWVEPFTSESYLIPEQGVNNLISKTESGEHVRIVRDFVAERASAENIITNCPILGMAKVGMFEWHCETIEESLQLLSELEYYRSSNSLTIKWPKGESIKFAGNVSTQNLRINIHGKQQWFEYSGEVEVDVNEVLPLQTLLTFSKQQGRFIELDNGKFIALSQKLKQHLDELNKLSEGNKIFNLNSYVLDNLVREAKTVNLDTAWQQHIVNVKSRQNFSPLIPSTLQTELRDYQIEGFNYLARLSNWQIGCCLADDMGLGKTIQTIALLLFQAEHGPSLVVAPTSVCFNWFDELTRFAPTLNVKTLHNEVNREECIKGVGSFDVVICSYNLLQYQIEILKSRNWNLVVLDEAQNIKNSFSKRFKAVCQLDANSRIALSGTPIENHLGELWSLFRFLNPGLLGGLESFQKKFIQPINNGDILAKDTLKHLIRPYILRRTKSQVLNELPAKTEKTIYIEPSIEEVAFYEALRQSALKNINGLEKDTNKRFGILAEITRLRQACCHSSLVDGNIHLANSKLDVFIELVQELIENNHKVLVFSQYVSYLNIVKDVLQYNNIIYQSIDGSTSLSERKEAVKSFQNGDGGDVFLISLKAGGTGLNLTAADYVIILDPWWNPALEDQAADRAHRFGQQRPVTVYRLVVKNTIEEKIINLHQEKRDLAGDVLAGHDVGAKLNENDLLGLMVG